MSEQPLVPITYDEELVVVRQRRYRTRVPEAHTGSLDTRIRWLWHQRFGTVQMIFQRSPDILDRTAATLIIQAIMAKDLEAINQIFQRIEGGAVVDTEVLEKSQVEMRL